MPAVLPGDQHPVSDLGLDRAHPSLGIMADVLAGQLSMPRFGTPHAHRTQPLLLDLRAAREHGLAVPRACWMTLRPFAALGCGRDYDTGAGRGPEAKAASISLSVRASQNVRSTASRAGGSGVLCMPCRGRASDWTAQAMATCLPMASQRAASMSSTVIARRMAHHRW
jgi:hypothetical protein